jgi:hypothetical protein
LKLSHLVGRAAIAASAAAVLQAWPSIAVAQSLESTARLDAQVDLRDVAVSGNQATGTVVNRSRNEVRDVVVMVNRAWVWRDERNPGPINPGGTYYFTLPTAVPAGGSAKFTFDLPPVDAPADLGSFQSSVAIQGYTEVEYPDR